MFIFKSIFLFFLIIFITFLLGVWQLYRLDWKNNLIDNFRLLEESKPVELENAEMKEFLKIKSLGTINRKNKIFLPAKTLNGQVGIRLASEFISNNGNIYLIDEGWFKNDYQSYFKSNNDIFEDIVIGYIRFPRDGNLFTPNNNLKKNEWYTYDLTLISDFFDTNLNNRFFIKKMNINKENFLIASNGKHELRNNHLQYAITWFCMSFSFLVIFLVNIKKINKRKSI